MTDTATDGVAENLKSIVHQLADASTCLADGDHARARDLMKLANIGLTALRVKFDQVLGPRVLPPAKRRA